MIFYQSWSDRSTRGIVTHVDILAVCTYNVCDVLPLPIEYGFGPCLLKNAERNLRYYVKRELPKQELWMNKWCHNALCYAFLMKHGIINLYKHMHFFRHLIVVYKKILFLINGCISYLLCTVYVSNHHCSQFLLTWWTILAKINNCNWCWQTYVTWHVLC